MSKDNEDQSMEEILQSIKRIIADEEEPETPGEEAPAEAVAEEASAEPEVAEEAAPEAEPAVEPDAEPKMGDDVLELTEVVEEGDAPAPEEEIELIAEDKEPEPEPEPTAPEPEAAPVPAPVTDDSLLSEASAIAASAALKSIPSTHQPSAIGFRSGTTVEDLVVESMKPMLKEWLDANLPDLVERLVAKEIKKLSQ